MPATPVTKDQRNLVRVLATDHNLKTVSELTKVPYDNVRQIVSRSARKHEMSQNVTKQVADRVQDELSENERKTKLSLSRYAARAAQDSETATLRESPYVKQAAQVAAIVHRWDQKEQSNNTVVNIALLGVQPCDVEVQTIDVDATVSE